MIRQTKKTNKGAKNMKEKTRIMLGYPPRGSKEMTPADAGSAAARQDNYDRQEEMLKAEKEAKLTEADRKAEEEALAQDKEMLEEIEQADKEIEQDKQEPETDWASYEDLTEQIQTLTTKALLTFAKDQADPIDYIKNELASRGIGPNGKWMGHEEARRYWENATWINNKEII